ncbi:MAG TPA: hypothetical protein DEO32_05470 [Ruminococcaceae bacterium]|nr:hypothetical protein [Oscillospiraceae bacterium]
MKLFINRDLSSSSEDFVFFDESGGERYATRRLGSNKIVGIKICGASGKTEAQIRRFAFGSANIFVLKARGARVTLAVVPSKNGAYSNFYGVNWHVCGNIATKNFSVIDVDKSVVFSHTRRSKYCELEIADEKNEIFCVAAAVCVNLINTVENRGLMPA